MKIPLYLLVGRITRRKWVVGNGTGQMVAWGGVFWATIVVYE